MARKPSYEELEHRVREFEEEILKHERIEHALEERRDYAEHIVAAVREPLVVLNADLRVVSASHSFYKTFAVKSEKTEGQFVYDLGNGQWNIPGLRELLEEIIPKNNTIEGFQIEHDFPTIGRRIMLLNARRIPTEADKTRLILLAIEDITERKQAEEKLNKAEYFERTLNEALRIALDPGSLENQLDRILDMVLKIPFLTLQSEGCICLVDNDKEVVDVKAQVGSCPEILSDDLPLPVGKCVCGQPTASNGILSANKATEPNGKCYECVESHGRYCCPIRSHDKMHGTINLTVKEGYKTDHQEMAFLASIANTIAGIIEHKTLEREKDELREQLIQSEKEAALGRMTDNIAHEIRNPLTALGGLARRLARRIPQETKEKNYVEVIVSDVIDDSLRLFEILYKDKGIKVQISRGDLPQINIDRERVRNIIDHLLSNSADALYRGGRITIMTGTEELERHGYVTVSITDTGTGIPETDQSKLFEPIFTTKAINSGMGVGLGLPICKKIMGEHDGLLRIQSEVEKGTTVKLFFPDSRSPNCSTVNLF